MKLEGIIFKATIVGMILVWLWAHCTYTGFLTQAEITFWGGKEPVSDEVNNQYHLDMQDTILYLDAGDAPFFFRANSSCRYSTPLPFQRDTPENWSLEWMPQFQEEAACIRDYQGRFIVMDASALYDWIGQEKSNRKDLNALLERNYTLVWQRCWRIYEKRMDLIVGS